MKHARIWTVVLLLGLAALAGCTVARAEDSPPTTVELPDGGSLSVSLDSLATDATLVTQPALEHADAGALARPAHGCMELGGYPLDVATPVRWICVVPLAEYEALNDAAAAEIAALRTLLAERPALSGQAGSLPDLPLGNSAQVFQSQPAYLDFTGGSGVRYLTLNV